MNSEKLDLLFERGILALILAILVYAPLAMGAVGPQEFLVVQALTVAVMFLWISRIIFIPKPRFFWPPLCWIVLAFSLYAIARYLTADIEYIARQELIQTLMYAFLFFAIVNNLTSKESTRVISFTLVFLAAGISCYAVWQYMAHSNRVWNLVSPYTGRVSGTYISPNNFSCFLEMLLPLALAYLLAGRVKPLVRILLGYAVLVMGAALTMTFSRGGCVAAAFGLLLLLAILICHPKHRLPSIALLIMMLVGGTFFVAKYLSRTVIYIERVQNGVENGAAELEYRGQMWQAAEEMWKDHFWFGVGPAHYDYRFRQYRPESLQGRPGRAHNDYLNLLADWGTTGGLIIAAGILIFMASLAWTLKALWPNKDDFGRGMSNRFAFFAGASGALFALGAHSVVDFNLHIPANAMLGVSLLALLTGQLRFATARFRIDAGIPAKILALVGLGGGIFYFSSQGVRSFQENYWLARSADSDLPVLERAGLMEKAFAIEPNNFQTAYNIGEMYRIQSFQGVPDYELLAKTAIDWYSRAMKLNPYDGYNYLCTGMCLDWIGRADEAEPYYSRAEALDPKGYYTVAWIGWHYVQTGDYSAARVWLERSMRLEWDINDIAHSYWEIVRDKLTQNASGQPQLPTGFR
jgi:O-antigen ligase